MHQPVMLKEVINLLDLKPGNIVLDATVGGGGHSERILKNILPGGKLIGLDADGSALKIAEENLKEFSGSFKLINENFRNLDAVLKTEKIHRLDAALFDLGVSSYQFDSLSRGFSIREDSKLDMRMDPRIALSAYDIVNRYKEKDLAEIIWQFGEERFSKRIARYIVEERSKNKIETTHGLAAVIHRAVGFHYKRLKIDAATRTFQAIRIVVNDELNALEEGLKKVVPMLQSGARICVISFHSLEDRIVKNKFREYSKVGELKIMTKKPMRPSAEEVISNPRSRSARLRAAERV